MKYLLIHNTIILLMLIFLCFAVADLHEDKTAEKDFIKSQPNGYYYGGGTLVIHMNDRNIEAYNKTLHHEFLHQLILEEGMREHFCG